MGFSIQTSRANACQAAIAGEMTVYTVAELKAAIAQAAAGHAEVEIDLAAIEAIDTAGLQLMLMAKRLPERSVRFVKHSPAVLRLLELANLAGAVGDPLILPRQDAEPTRGQP